MQFISRSIAPIFARLTKRTAAAVASSFNVSSSVTAFFPLFWKMMMKRYSEIFFTSLLGIVSLLLTSRLEEVARFIAVGASYWKIFLFILCQIPYILQIGLPISGFIAGYSLASKMSHAGEIASCRAVGASLFQLFLPVILLSTFFSFISFLFIFDLAAKSHLTAKQLEFDVRAKEPLALLQSTHFLNEHSVILELSGSLKKGAHADDVLICMTPKGQERLTLALFVEAHAGRKSLQGQTLTVFSTTKPKDGSPSNIGTSCIENAQRKRTPTAHLHELIQKRSWNVGSEHLPLKSVIAMQSELKKQVIVEKFKGHAAKNIVKKYNRFTSESYRRMSLSVAIATLTLTGLMFGVQTSRVRNPFHLVKALFPFFTFLALYLLGKNIDEIAFIAIACYCISHIYLLWASHRQNARIEAGTL